MQLEQSFHVFSTIILHGMKFHKIKSQKRQGSHYGLINSTQADGHKYSFLSQINLAYIFYYFRPALCSISPFFTLFSIKLSPAT